MVFLHKPEQRAPLKPVERVPVLPEQRVPKIKKKLISIANFCVKNAKYHGSKTHWNYGYPTNYSIQNQAV